MPEFETKAKTIMGDSGIAIDLTTLGKTQGEHQPLKLDFVPGNLGHPAFIILTSGTTGMPKGAVHSLDSLIINLIELGDMAGINDTMRGVLPLPLSHIFGLEVFWTAYIRGTVVVFSELSPTSFVQAVAKHKPHIIAGVPTLYGALLAAPKEALDLSNGVLLLSGGAPLPISLADEFEMKFGKRINNGYGSTESKIVALNQKGPIEAVGQIVPSVKIDIVNDQDEVLPLGDVGEIRITGPILMQGYLNMAEATTKVLRDGHYYTGDMGFFKDGNLYIAGRSKEMVIVAGYKVFPVEVEDALRKHPLVKEVAVLGQPHKQLGQIVKAVVVVNDGDLSNKLEGEAEQKKDARQHLLGELKEYCKGNLRRELRPMEWEFQPASKPLPKTGTGKVDKKQLEMASV
jgi:long-chain acyl-CoA synthetase